MKNVIGFAALLLIFYACKQNESNVFDSMVFSGSIEHSSKDSLQILDAQANKILSISVKDGLFSDTFDIDTGFYLLAIGQEYTEVFLTNGMNLHIAIDEQAYDESIVYSGEGAVINNYLAKKTLHDEEMILYYTDFLNMDENTFLKTMDSVFQLKLHFLQSFDSLPAYFTNLDSARMVFDEMDFISTYKLMECYAKDSTNKVSASFPDVFKDLDKNIEDFAILNEYIQLLDSYFNMKLSGMYQKKDSVDALTKIKIINQEITNQNVKNNLLGYIGMMAMDPNEYLVQYAELKDNITNNKIKAKLKEKYDSYLKLKKGQQSPIFNLKNNKDEVFNLGDMKGKLVYIDVWSTWCAPCKKEIPFLLDLQQEYMGKEINFVSICINSDKDEWLSMIEEKKLGGIQLFATKDEMTFVDDYMIRGVPTFILVDKNGAILDANAPRPSNEQLKEILNNNL